MEKIKEALRGGLPCDNNGYLDSYLNNIFTGYMPDKFRNMFMDGSGNELRSKAAAVHSSSMLGYNFFHWVSEKYPLTIQGIKYTKVFFEVKMAVLKGTLPANMDILLVGEKEGKMQLLFLESKFLEFLEKRKFILGVSYRNKDKWLYKEKDWFPFLTDVQNCVNEDNDCVYEEGIKQGVSHLFAITNLVNDNEEAITDFIVNNEFLNGYLDDDSIRCAEFHFINIIFKPSEKQFKAEYDKYYAYETLYKIFISIAEKHKCIEPYFMTYSELWKMAEKEIMKVNNGHLHQYLNDRYMRFAEMK